MSYQVAELGSWKVGEPGAAFARLASAEAFELKNFNWAIKDGTFSIKSVEKKNLR